MRDAVKAAAASDLGGPKTLISLESEGLGMEAPAGFEPANAGFAVPCLTNLATVPCLEGPAGIAETDPRQGPY